MQFGLEISGERDARLVFDKFPDIAHDRIVATMSRLLDRLRSSVVSAEPNRTGELRGATRGTLYDNREKGRVAAVVGVRTQDGNVARKAATLEYGSHRSFTVRAHNASLNHIWSRAISPIQVRVPAHSRVSNIGAHRFLRAPLDAMRSDAMAQLQAAIEGAAEDASR